MYKYNIYYNHCYIYPRQLLLVRIALQTSGVECKANFVCIVESIKKLETSNLSLIDSLKILEQVENSVNELPTSVNSTIIKTKCKNVLNKNKGLMVLKEISKILQGDSANFNDLSVPNYSPDILANFKYVPITS